MTPWANRQILGDVNEPGTAGVGDTLVRDEWQTKEELELLHMKSDDKNGKRKAWAEMKEMSERRWYKMKEISE